MIRSVADSLSPKLAGLIVLLISLLSCRPIVAIGWPELIILVVLVAVLLGPLLFKLYRFLDKVQKVSRAEEKKKKQG
jgi:hypothetical protein